MSIKVITAVYGTTHNGMDVTSTVQERLDLGNDDVIVTNEALGGDPDEGIKKFFGILYTLPDGTVCARCALEDDVLELID